MKRFAFDTSRLFLFLRQTCLHDLSLSQGYSYHFCCDLVRRSLLYGQTVHLQHRSQPKRRTRKIYSDQTTTHDAIQTLVYYYLAIGDHHIDSWSMVNLGNELLAKWMDAAQASFRDRIISLPSPLRKNASSDDKRYIQIFIDAIADLERSGYTFSFCHSLHCGT